MVKVLDYRSPGAARTAFAGLWYIVAAILLALAHSTISSIVFERPPGGANNGYWRAIGPDGDHDPTHDAIEFADVFDCPMMQLSDAAGIPMLKSRYFILFSALDSLIWAFVIVVTWHVVSIRIRRYLH